MSSNMEPVNLVKRAVVEDIHNEADEKEAASNNYINDIGCVDISSEPPSKKVKKIKDPNAPRRPLNIFFRFQRDYRALLLAQNPAMPYSEITGKIKEAFDKLSPDEKARYEAEFKKDSERYTDEMKRYTENPQEFVSESERSFTVAVNDSDVKVPSVPIVTSDPVDPNESVSIKKEKKNKKDVKSEDSKAPINNSIISESFAIPTPSASPAPSSQDEKKKKKKSSSKHSESEASQSA